MRTLTSRYAADDTDVGSESRAGGAELDDEGVAAPEQGFLEDARRHRGGRTLPRAG